MIGHTVTISDSLYRRLQQQARASRQSVDELVQETLIRQLPPSVPIEEDLPTHLQAELEAMSALSDIALWAVARSTLPVAQQETLAQLNLSEQQRPLTKNELEQRDRLLILYEETVLRRSHAAILLKSRGYDISDPSVLRPQ
jgi:hypothetical protein